MVFWGRGAGGLVAVKSSKLLHKIPRARKVFLEHYDGG